MNTGKTNMSLCLLTTFSVAQKPSHQTCPYLSLFIVSLREAGRVLELNIYPVNRSSWQLAHTTQGPLELFSHSSNVRHSWATTTSDNECLGPCHCHPWARLDINNSVFSSRKNTQSTCKVVYSRILNRFIWVMARKGIKKIVRMFSNKSLEVIALVSAPKFHYNKAITKKSASFSLHPCVTESASPTTFGKADDY